MGGGAQGVSGGGGSWVGFVVGGLMVRVWGSMVLQLSERDVDPRGRKLVASLLGESVAKPAFALDSDHGGSRRCKPKPTSLPEA